MFKGVVRTTIANIRKVGVRHDGDQLIPRKSLGRRCGEQLLEQLVFFGHGGFMFVP